MSESDSGAAETTVCVIGGGASGILTAVNLLREGAQQGRRLRVTLIEERDSLGGLAYLTDDPRHLLNVAAAGMSAFEGEPDHFVQWARSRALLRDPAEFVARGAYGQYLQWLLARSSAESGTVRLQREVARVGSVRRNPHGGWSVLRTDGHRTTAEHVVLALGSPPTPVPVWALNLSDRYITDPYAAGALERAKEWRRVLILGTGLTMADAVSTLADGAPRVHAVSRTGLLPRDQVVPGAAPRELTPPPVHTLDAMRAWFIAEVETAKTQGQDWRSVVDGMRPFTPELWGRLTAADQARFLAEDARHWEVRRHRMAPVTAQRVSQLAQEGRLRVSTGEMVGAIRRGDTVVVTLDAEGFDGLPAVPVVVDGVINATGPGDARRNPVGLVAALVLDDVAVEDSFGFGIRTGPAGQVQGPDGRHQTGLWVVGPLRRAAEYECTAVPELRCHAAEVASRIVAVAALVHGGELSASTEQGQSVESAGAVGGDSPVAGASRPAGHGRILPVDPYDLPLFTTAEAAGAYCVGLRRVLSMETGAEEALRDAVRLDPRFALGHAALAVLGVEAHADRARIERRLAAAGRHARRASERERSVVSAISQWCRTEGGDSREVEAHVAQWPSDALAVSMLLPTISFSAASTDPNQAWSMLDRVAAGYPRDDWWLTGMQAFARAEQKRWAESGELAERALSQEGSAGHAAHAMAHVLYETGRHNDAVDWIDGWMAGPGGQQQFSAHFSWHAAMCELALGEREHVQQRYDSQLAPLQGLRALIDGASLLANCSLSGMALAPDRADAVAEGLDNSLLLTPASLFGGWHAAVLHAHRGDPASLAALGRHAAEVAASTGVETMARGWQVLAQLCDGLVAWLDGRPEQASQLLLPVAADSALLGGSPLQRELLEDLALTCLLEAGDTESLQRLVQGRLDRRPTEADRRRLNTVANGPAAMRRRAS